MSDQTTVGRANREPLRRDRRSKVIAGVCGGLGGHLDIDPVVFRILFAVLTFVGGIGLLAYAAAWLFVPVEGARKSEAHRLLTGSNPLLAVIVAVGLALGALASISALTNGLTAMWPLMLIGAAVLGVLVWRGDIKLGRGETARSSQPPTWWQQPMGEPAGEAQGRAQGTATAGVDESGEPRDATPAGFAAYAASGVPGGSGTASASSTATGALGAFGASAGTEGSAAGGEGEWVDLSRLHGGPGPEAAFTEAMEPARRPRRRGYGGLVFASLLAATGVIGVLDAAGLVTLTWLSGGALVLVLLGAGMTLGGMFGKTTALVPMGLVVAVPLLVLAAADVPLHGTVGDENWAPASAARTHGSYQVGVGDGELDLTGSVPGAGRTLAVQAQVGIGELAVQVPPNVTVRVHAHAGIGDIQVQAPGAVVQDSDGGAKGTSVSGVGRSVDFVIPAQGESEGTLVLDLNTGIGDVTVEGQGQ
jgi:phage shock protein PspC (stress-responsive transcriptional regulator)